jgi:hypothetical protein
MTRRNPSRRSDPRPLAIDEELPWWRSPVYRAWEHMLERCENPRCKSYRLYGAKGVTVCERWHSYDNFCQDMGPRPPGHSIDRIDSNGNYEPSNCRWATIQQQNQNTSKNVFTEEDVRQVKCLHRLGIASRWIAKTFKVGHDAVSYVVRGRTWTNVE